MVEIHRLEYERLAAAREIIPGDRVRRRHMESLQGPAALCPLRREERAPDEGAGKGGAAGARKAEESRSDEEILAEANTEVVVPTFRSGA